MAGRAAYRVVQEALTNAAKHAPGGAVTVALGRDGDNAVVTVTNTAPSAEPLPATLAGGYGLVGLDERVRLAGGILRAKPVDGGFSVVARLPLTAGSPASQPQAQRQHSLARRKARRSLIDVILVLVAAAAAVLLLSLIGNLFTATR